MQAPNHFRNLLADETAHLTTAEKDRLFPVWLEARHLVRTYPRATAVAVADKLFTLFEAPRWVCVLIAKAAFEVEACDPAQALQVAA